VATFPALETTARFLPNHKVVNLF